MIVWKLFFSVLLYNEVWWRTKSNWCSTKVLSLGLLVVSARSMLLIVLILRFVV